MERRRSILFLVILFVFTTGLHVNARNAAGVERAASGDKSIQGRVDAVMRRATKQPMLPGVSIAAMRGKTLPAAKGYGLADLEKKIPARADTIYRTGSVGKQFAAATLLRLAEQNKVSLEDPIGEYLPGFPERLQAITVRQVLSHTSGLREINADPQFARSQGVGMTFDQVLRLVAQQPLEFRPGTKYSYSNSGYLVAGGIIERVTGRPAARFMVDEILRPLGLRNTSDCARRRTAQWAAGYEPQESRGWSRIVRLGRSPALVPPRPINLRAISAAGAFCSTPVDLVRWTQALHHGDLLTPQSLKEMTRPAVLSGGGRAPYGLGTQIREFGSHRAFAHSGIIWGFNAVTAYFPDEDLAVAMMLNSLLPGDQAAALWEQVLGAVFDEKPARWKEARYEAAR